MRHALHLLREYFAIAVKAGRWRAPAAVLLAVTTGLVEGVGLLFLIPLLGLVGVDIGGSATDAVSERIGAGLSSIGLPATLPVVLALFVVVTTTQALIVMAQALVNLRLEARLSSHLRRQLYDAILRAEWTVLSRQRGSDLVHTMTTEVDRTGALTHQALSTVAVVAQIAVAFAVAARIAPVTTGVVLATGLVLLVALRSLAAQSTRLGREYAHESTQAYGVLTDGLAALRTIKTLGAERHSAAIVGESQDRLVTTWHRLVRSSVRAKFAIDACSAVVLALVVYVAITLLHVSTGALLVLLFICARAIPRVASLQHTIRLVLQALPAFDRVHGLTARLQGAPESAAADGAAPPLAGAITLDAVTFAYDEGRPALDGVSLDVPAGRISALVGMSGAGKTTIADLVLGLLTPDAGAVRIDGRELSAEARRAWRAKVAYVSQDPFFFHDTIAANLRWARQSATDGEINEALTLAGAAQFVARLPEGLATVVGDRGSRLSGGERQRLAIARAVLRRPDVLVLDEPTSALDALHEQHVMDLIRRLARTTTVLLITHRLNSVRIADRIHVLDGGRLVESGSWDELSDEGRTLGRLSRLQGVAP